MALRSSPVTISVLYVDDEPGLLEIAKIFLERSGGFNVDTSTSAREALESPKIQSYDAIIADYQMPEMDGIAFLKEVRRKFGNIPFILFTGRGREEVVIDAINNGADFYLQKGGDPQSQFAELAHKIRQAVTRRERENEIASFFQAAPVGIAVVSDRVLLRVNDRLCAITGYPREELEGRNTRFLYLNDEDYSAVGRMRDQAYQQGIPDDVEIQWMRKDGTVFDVHITAAAIDPSNPAAPMTYSALDITKRKRAERSLMESEGFLNSFFEQSPDPLWISDDTGTLIRLNQACRDMLRITDADIVGKYNIFHDKNIQEQGFISLVRRMFDTGETVNFLLIFDSAKLAGFSIPPSIKRTLAVTILPIRNSEGRITKAVVHHTDITGLKEAEEALRKSREQLSDAMDLAGLVNWEYEFRTGTLWFDNRFFAMAGTTAEREGGNRMPVETYTREFVHPDDMHAVAEEIGKGMKSTDPEYGSRREHRIVRRDGGVRWVQTLIRITRDEEGRPVKVHGTIQDLTEQKRAEHALRESEERLQLALDGGDLGTWNWNVVTGEVIFNERWVAMLGYRLSEIEPHIRSWERLVHPDDMLRVMETLNTHLEGRTDHYECEHRLLHKSGAFIWVLDKGRVIRRDAEGRPLVAAGTHLDITRRKMGEEELRKIEARYRLLADNVHDVIWTTDRNMRFTYISPSVMALRGLTPEEAMDETFEEALTPESYRALIGSREKGLAALKKGIPIPPDLIMDLEFRCRDGSTVWTEMAISPVFDPNGMPAGAVGIIRDITLRRQVEKTLRESEAKLRSVLDNFPDLVLVHRDGIIRYVNPAMIDTLGKSPENVLNTSVLEYIPRQYHDRITAAISDRTETGRHTPYEMEIDSPVRGHRIVLVRSSVIEFDGSPAVLAVLTDVTEQKRVEEALRESEEKFRSFVENANDIVFSLTPDGITSYVSPNWTEILGHDTAEIIGKPMRHIHPEDLPRVQEFLRETMATGKKAGGIEYRIQHKDGTWRWHTQNISPIHDASGNVVAIHGICHDTTERRNTEEALRRANRQLSLLTGITRHDILNKVSVILGFLAIARMKSSDPALGDYLMKTEDATKAIKSQIEFTRIYQDLGAHEAQWIALDTVMPTSQVPPAITLRTEVRGISVFADPMLEKVFFNLLDNSIRHGEHVTEIRMSPRRSGGDLVIVWEDNGVGIADDEKQRIFERGFGKNMGLGMFLAREILSLTGITIRETGEPGKGARFEITVPKDQYRCGPW